MSFARSAASLSMKTFVVKMLRLYPFFHEESTCVSDHITVAAEVIYGALGQCVNAQTVGHATTTKRPALRRARQYRMESKVAVLVCQLFKLFKPKLLFRVAQSPV